MTTRQYHKHYVSKCSDMVFRMYLKGKSSKFYSVQLFIIQQNCLANIDIKYSTECPTTIYSLHHKFKMTLKQCCWENME